jgi:hypothetical protein
VENFELGTGTRTSHRGVVFNNTELSGNTDYFVFIRAFSSVDGVRKGKGKCGKGDERELG